MIRVLIVILLISTTIFAETEHDEAGGRNTNKDVRNSKYLELCAAEKKANVKSATPVLDDKTLAAYDVLRNNCASCHSVGSSDGAKNFSDILDVEQLVRNGILTAKDAKSKLLEQVNSDQMPMGSKPLSKEEKKILADWIADGAKSFSTAPTVPDVGFISQDDIEVCMVKDLRKNVDKNSQPFIRYLNLANLYNSGRKGELERTRLAVNKLLNSLSWKREIKNPEVVDGTGTLLRLDLRHYGLAKSDWERLVKANPYVLGEAGEAAKEVAVATQTQSPVLRADWVVFAGSRPPLYHELLRIPQRTGTTSAESQLEEFLAVNSKEARINGEETRAAFTQSDVTKSNRAISHFDTPFGSYWRSDDTKTKVGDQNILENPINTRIDGGEYIFTLPNGLHGYLITDAQGNRLDGAPKEVVIDPNRLHRDEVVLNGVSCINCHQKGMKRKSDEVLAHYQALRKKFPNDEKIKAEAEEVEKIFKGNDELKRLFIEEEQSYEKAVAKTGNNVNNRDPIFATGEAFEASLGLQEMAVELGVTPDELQKVFESDAALAKSIGLGSSARLDREIFNSKFAQLRDLVKGKGGKPGKAPVEVAAVPTLPTQVPSILLTNEEQKRKQAAEEDARKRQAQAEADRRDAELREVEARNRAKVEAEQRFNSARTELEFIDNDIAQQKRTIKNRESDLIELKLDSISTRLENTSKATKDLRLATLELQINSKESEIRKAKDSLASLESKRTQKQLEFDRRSRELGNLR